MPFQAVTTLSSRTGCGRRSRAASSAARTRRQRAASSGSAGSCSVDEPCSKVPLRRHLEQLRGPCAVHLPEHLDQLGGRPGVGQALDAVGVGVESRGEAALGRAEVAQQERRSLLRDAPGERGVRARYPGEVGVGAQQQRVVVEHLLEVRYHPPRIHAVAGETARELVVQTAASHPRRRRGGEVQRVRRARAFVVAQEELQRHRRRELGRPAEPAVHRVELVGQRLDGGVQRLGLQARGRQRGGGVVGQPRRDLSRRAADPPAVVDPGLRHGVEQTAEVRRRVVRAAVERLAGRGEEAGHRPAALPGQRLGGGHVDRVDVGPLLAVDLDGDEAGVDLRGGGGVVERLVGHDVAPVAGGVADGSSTGTSRRAASSKAASDHSHQSTGLSACWRRYGLVAPERRFGMTPACQSTGSPACRAGSSQSRAGPCRDRHPGRTPVRSCPPPGRRARRTTPAPSADAWSSTGRAGPWRGTAGR